MQEVETHFFHRKKTVGHTDFRQQSQAIVVVKIAT
jgi:hypothetical protein